MSDLPIRNQEEQLFSLNDQRPIHFTGIAGAGMRALAELVARRGVSVQGTDANIGSTDDLRSMGITVSLPDESIVARARALVYSSAVHADHPEIVAARNAGIPVIRRAEALAAAVNGGTLIGIAGTHGKTTTTVMTTEALTSAGRNPTGVVGGRVPEWNGNLRAGGDTYVVEADEYDRSFLALDPTVAVILNVEADHLDIYQDIEDIKRAFSKFISRASIVVRCADDEGAMSVEIPTGAECISYSVSLPDQASAPFVQGPARMIASGVSFSGTGSTFEVTFDGARLGDVKLSVPGLHNVRNALAAISAGIAIGSRFDEMTAGLAAFRGVDRRFQLIGEAAGVTVIDDYAHHPTEVKATLSAARGSFPGRRIVVAFQPHLFSRTRDLKAEFADALAGADVLFLCDIYGAREAPEPGVTSDVISELIPKGICAWRGARAAASRALASFVRTGDVVLTMGAGDITMTGPELLGLLGGRV